MTGLSIVPYKSVVGCHGACNGSTEWKVLFGYRLSMGFVFGERPSAREREERGNTMVFLPFAARLVFLNPDTLSGYLSG